MRKIRVLIVDDAVVVRRMVSDALASDPSIEVVGVAANGQIALSKIPQVNPDLVTLDIEMPVMNGLETLAEIRRVFPRLPVIMFSTLTQRGAEATLDAMSMGANDYVTKPTNVGSAAEAMRQIRDTLIPKIKAFCSEGINVPPPPAVPRVTSPLPPSPIPRPQPANVTAAFPQRIDIVAIGVSTGGPNVLATLLPQFGANFPAPIVIVQHMPPIFTRLLANRLTTQSTINVSEGKSGDILEPSHATLAPGDYHMLLERDAATVKVRLNQNAPENFCRPAVDVLFRSVAKIYGSHALAVVLTGMGRDGLQGCESVRQAGGQVFVQDKGSSVVWGMPGAVVEAGLADKVLPIDQLGAEIMQKVRAFRTLN